MWTASEKGGKKTDESRAIESEYTVDASHTPPSAVVAFGCILNEAERLAWWGVVLGA